MPGSSSWMPCAAQRVKGLDDDNRASTAALRPACVSSSTD